MAQSGVLAYCILNVSASPHPKGIYVQLLTEAAEFETNYWGDRNARISAPMLVEDGFYRGRIATWNDIDFEQPGVSKRDLEEIDLSAIGNSFPPEVGVNGRIFSYVLRERDHKVFVETRNESGQTLSPKQTGSIFKNLIDHATQRRRGMNVEVTVIPDEEAIEQILGLDHLKVLKIRLVRPNADEIGEDALDILDELEMQGAKNLEKTLRAAAGESLKPNERTTTQAWVGSTNGFVEGQGNDADGQPKSYSTRAHPRIIQRTLADVGSSFGSILSVAKETIFRRRRREDL